jgi:hypothetical protein
MVVGDQTCLRLLEHPDNGAQRPGTAAYVESKTNLRRSAEHCAATMAVGRPAEDFEAMVVAESFAEGAEAMVAVEFRSACSEAMFAVGWPVEHSDAMVSMSAGRPAGGSATNMAA